MDAANAGREAGPSCAHTGKQAAKNEKHWQKTVSSNDHQVILILLHTQMTVRLQVRLLPASAPDQETQMPSHNRPP